MPAATRERGVLARHERSQVLRLFMMVLALVTGLAIALGTLLSAAQAAPEGKLTQFKVPTAGSSPEHITQASDGTFWFTESFVNDQNAQGHKVGQLDPDTGDITEFVVCDFCFPTDIVQGSDGILYFTKNDASLGRITTDGTVLPDIPSTFSPNGSGLDAHGDEIWFADFNNHSVWRYDISDNAFTEFPAPNTVPLDVAVDANGVVWFTDANGQIGRLDPNTSDPPVVTEIDVEGFPREINIASDGAVWFTERFDPQAVGRIDPATNEVRLFPDDGGPLDIAPAADGSMWFTRTTAGNIARITPDGVITTQSKAVKGSEPFGITVTPNGAPWFTMLSADKIATFQLTK
jgi:virginiamycin B lyase